MKSLISIWFWDDSPVTKLFRLHHYSPQIKGLRRYAYNTEVVYFAMFLKIIVNGRGMNMGIDL